MAKPRASEKNDTTQSPAEVLPVVQHETDAEFDPAEQEARAFSAEFERIRNELLYLKAEFENYKKRLRRDQKEAIEQANEALIRDLVPVADHLHRALDHMQLQLVGAEPGQAQIDAILDGIHRIERELQGFFDRAGVKFFGRRGERFNPELHQAISQQAVEAEQDGKIVGIVGEGCWYRGKMLNPARVIVGTK